MSSSASSDGHRSLPPSSPPPRSSSPSSSLSTARRRTIDEVDADEVDADDLSLKELVQKLNQQAKKKKKDDELQEYRTMARLIPRVLGLFVDVRLIFAIGSKPAEPAMQKEKDMPADERRKRENLRWIYRELVRMHPSLPKLLKNLKKQNAVDGFIDIMRQVAMQVRADDTTSLRRDWTGFFFSDPDTQRFTPPIVAGVNKSTLGFNHLDTARALVPITLLDKVTSLDCQILIDIREGREVITHDKYPAFMYAEGSFTPSKLDKGLCRGHLLLVTLRYEWTGPGSVKTGPAHTPRNKSNAKIHDITAVTPRMIAYAACQARFMISSAENWQHYDGAFSYEGFYNCIVELFAMDQKWSDETLAWWNEQVFGTVNETAPAQPQGLSMNDQLRMQRLKERDAEREAVSARASEEDGAAHRDVLASIDQNAA